MSMFMIVFPLGPLLGVICNVVELRFVEMGAMGVYWAWFCALCGYTESGMELAAYVILSHGVSGGLHIQITLSHFVMETFTKHQPVYTNDENDWFRLQLLSEFQQNHQKSHDLSATCAFSSGTRNHTKS